MLNANIYQHLDASALRQLIAERDAEINYLGQLLINGTTSDDKIKNAHALLMTRLMQQVQANEVQYAALFNSANDGIFLLNNEVIVDCNQRMLDVLKCSLNDVIGKTILDISYHENIQKQNASILLSNYFETTIKNNSFMFEWAFMQPNAQLVETEINCSRVELNGNVYIQGIVRDITLRKQIERDIQRRDKVIKEIYEKLIPVAGNEFFPVIVRQLTISLHADFAFIGEYNPITNIVRSISAYADGKYVENFEYNLADTPCETVFVRGICSYTDDVHLLFPHDVFLADFGARSYVGISLHSHVGKPEGIMVVLFKNKLVNESFVEMIMQIFSARAEAELHQRTINKNIQTQNHLLDLALFSTQQALWQINTDNLQVKINQGMAHLLGYSLDNFDTNDIRKYLQNNNLDIFNFSVQKYIQNPNEQIKIELPFVCANGTERWFSVRGQIIDNKTIIGTFADIHDRKTSENEKTRIMEEVEQYRNHLEDLVRARTGEIHQLNEQLSLFNQELQTKNTELAVKQSIMEKQAEELLFTNDRLEKQKQVVVKALDNLKKTQAQLIQSEKMASLGILTAGIAHEINNPINFISSNLEGLKISLTRLLDILQRYQNIDLQQPTNDLLEIENYKKQQKFDLLIEAVHKITGNIQSGVYRTTDIVRSLRTFARTDDNNYSQADLADMINSNLLLLQSQYKNRITIQCNYQHTSLLNCMWGKINQVIMNLIINAIDAIPEQGVISIDTWENEARFFIKISDTGGGIPEKHRNKIFEPFFTTKDVGKGTGLGLYISYGIVQQHEGKLELLETSEKGTSFIVNLPKKI